MCGLCSTSVFVLDSRLPVTDRSEICMVFEALDTDLLKIGKSKAHVLGEKHVRKIMYEVSQDSQPLVIDSAGLVKALLRYVVSS
jgi:hypothetical protein